MSRGLRIWGNASVGRDRLGSGIVGGERQFEAAEASHLREEITGTAFEVLNRIACIDLKDGTPKAWYERLARRGLRTAKHGAKNVQPAALEIGGAVND